MMLVLSLTSCAAVREIGATAGSIIQEVGSVVDEDLGKGLGQMVSAPLAAPANYLDQQKQKKDANTVREQRIRHETEQVQQTISDLRRSIQEIQQETALLVSSSQDLTDRIAASEFTLAEQTSALTNLRQDKTRLVAQIAKKKEEISRLRVNYTVALYIKRRKELGDEDPVDEQLKKLQAVTTQVNNVVIP